MKEDFLVIDHNMLLRRLYLKCNLLYILQEYYVNKNRKNVCKMLETNSELNKYLDNETNIEADEVVLEIENKIDTNKLNINKIVDNKNIEDNKKIVDDKNIENNKNIVDDKKIKNDKYKIDTNIKKKKRRYIFTT